MPLNEKRRRRATWSTLPTLRQRTCSEDSKQEGVFRYSNWLKMQNSTSKDSRINDLSLRNTGWRSIIAVIAYLQYNKNNKN